MKKIKFLTDLVDYFFKKIKNPELKKTIEVFFAITIIVLIALLLFFSLKLISPENEDLQSLLEIFVGMIALYFMWSLTKISNWIKQILGFAAVILIVCFHFKDDILSLYPHKQTISYDISVNLAINKAYLTIKNQTNKTSKRILVSERYKIIEIDGSDKDVIKVTFQNSDTTISFNYELPLTSEIIF